MKHVFKLNGAEVNDILARFLIAQEGWTNELCSWRCTLSVRPDEFEVTLEKIPVRLRIPEVKP